MRGIIKVDVVAQFSRVGGRDAHSDTEIDLSSLKANFSFASSHTRSLTKRTLSFAARDFLSLFSEKKKRVV